jgi:vacuolar-type H+-ATPase subunit H
VSCRDRTAGCAGVILVALAAAPECLARSGPAGPSHVGPVLSAGSLSPAVISTSTTNGLGTLLVLAPIAAVIAALLFKPRTEGGRMPKLRWSPMDLLHAQNDSPQSGASDGANAQPAVAVVASDSSGSESAVDRLGPHVTSIMRAAEEAAARMVEEARDEAGRLLEQAPQEAAATVEAARREADGSKVGAKRLRTETEEWAKRARASAESDAMRRRSEADTEAKRLVDVATQQAASITSKLERQHKALESSIAAGEERTRELVSQLHDLAVQLESLLYDRRARGGNRQRRRAGFRRRGALAVRSRRGRADEDDLTTAPAPDQSVAAAPRAGQLSLHSLPATPRRPCSSRM